MQKEKRKAWWVSFSLTCFLIFTLFSCGRKLETYEKLYPGGELMVRGTVYREPNGVEVKHGLWTEWYNNGQKALERTYRDGRPEGAILGWHKDGRQQLVGRLEDGMPHGVWLWWHENGQKLLEGSWARGLKHGLWTFWYDNGRKEMEGKYDRGESDGKWTYWDTSGKKLREEFYRKGRKIKEVKY